MAVSAYFNITHEILLTALMHGANLYVISFYYSTKHADSIDLELEVDPLNVDHFSCTPLVSFW